MAQLDRVTITVELTLETNVHSNYVGWLANQLKSGELKLVVNNKHDVPLHTVRVCAQHVERAITDPCDKCSQAEMLDVLTFGLK